MFKNGFLRDVLSRAIAGVIAALVLTALGFIFRQPIWDSLAWMFGTIWDFATRPITLPLMVVLPVVGVVLWVTLAKIRRWLVKGKIRPVSIGAWVNLGQVAFQVKEYGNEFYSGEPYCAKCLSQLVYTGPGFIEKMYGPKPTDSYQCSNVGCGIRIQLGEDTNHLRQRAVGTVERRWREEVTGNGKKPSLDDRRWVHGALLPALNE